MKKSAIILSLILLMVACKPAVDPNVIPETLEGKKAFLSAKKKEIKEIQAQIKKVTKQINKLDPPKEKKAIPVEIKKLEAKEFKRFVEVQANVMAEDIGNASSETGGRIVSLKVDEGDYVKKGQLIATTDMITMENQIGELETSLSLAQTVFERQKRLWDQNIGSELQYLEAKNNKERLEKSIQTIKSQYDKKNIYAPMSGFVDMKLVNQGEMVSPGMPIIQILNTSKLKVVANLQESMLGAVKKGDKVDVYFPALDLTKKSTITMVGRSIDPANRTFKIEIAISSQGGKLKPNVMAQVKFNDLTQSNVVVIPIETIQEDVAGNKYVFKTKTKDGKKLAEKTFIELGESSDEGAIILIGLSSGDELITAGGTNLNDSDPIDIINK